MKSMPLHLLEQEPDPVLVEFDGLRDWVRQQAREQATADFAEQGIESRGRELCRLLMVEFVKLCGVGDVGEAVEATTVRPLVVVKSVGESQTVHPAGELVEEVLLTHRREREIQHTTVFGVVPINRLGFGQRGQESLFPLDEQLALPARSYSYHLQKKWMTGIARGPFQEATKSVEEATAQKVATANAGDVIVDAAQDFEPFYRSRPTKSPEEAAPLQVAIVDGKGIRIRERVEEAAHKEHEDGDLRQGTKQMATVAAVYNIQPHVRTIDDIVRECHPKPLAPVPVRPRPEDKRIWASLTKTKDDVFAEVAEEMARRDPEHQKKWVCITDGERALRQRARLILGALGPFILILDLWHALEYLWDAANAMFGKGTAQAKDWCTEQLRHLLEGKASDVARGMRQSATKRGIKGERRKTIDRTAAYFLSNKESMKYHEYIAEGLPIGSGVGEGAVKNLIKDRLERTGMHWSRLMAEAVLKMRAIELCGDTDVYWEFHIAAEQTRLHGNRLWKPFRVS